MKVLPSSGTSYKLHMQNRKFVRTPNIVVQDIFVLNLIVPLSNPPSLIKVIIIQTMFTISLFTLKEHYTLYNEMTLLYNIRPTIY